MNKSRKFLFLLAVGAAAVAQAQTYETPTMGWSSWNAFGFNISESIIKSHADAMQALGFQDAGYNYLNIDDGYFGGRDAQGRLLINAERFPNGMKPVVDHIHALGLKAGIYSDAGRNTCASYHGGDTWGVGVGLYGHDQEDMDLFFKTLDFDFIKVDFCGGAAGHNNDGAGGSALILDEQERYTAISQAIKNTGKQGVRLNVCRWAFPGTWVHDVATSWRTTGDIYLGWKSVRGILAENLYLSAYATEGKFNDMDMLEVGRGLTEEEDKTHFGMWCIMSSPLLIGCDLTTIPSKAKALMLNPELISLNQDPLALQAYVVKKQNGGYVLVKDVETLHGTTRAVAFYNPTDAAIQLDVAMHELDLGGQVQVRDLFERADLPDVAGIMAVSVPAHGTRIYRLEAERRYERARYEAETAWLSAYQELWNNQSKETGIYEEAAYCSGGAKAGWLGKSENNDLQWRNVYSRDGGRYTMTLTYICGASRNVTVSVNGTAVQTLSLNSGDWNKTATTQLAIDLKPGNNVVRLSNAADWMPDIDCMVIEREGSLELSHRELESAIDEAQMLLDQDLPEAWKSLLHAAIAQAANVEETADALAQAIASVKAAVQEVKGMIAKNEAFISLCSQCLGLTDCAIESQALAQLQASIASQQAAVAAATSQAEIQAATTALHGAAVEFLESNDAQPAEGKALDITLLIVNPTMEPDGAGWGGNPTYREGVGEFWNKTFDLSQTVSHLKPGNYTIEAQALYRIAKNETGSDNAYNSGTEKIPAVLYADASTSPLPSLYSHKFPMEEGETYADTEVRNGYANSMHAAAVCFDEGAYKCSVDASITGTTMRIGLKCETTQYDSWCSFDNFRLLYLGNPAYGSIQPIAADPEATPSTPSAYTISGTPARPNQRGLLIINGQKLLLK